MSCDKRIDTVTQAGIPVNIAIIGIDWYYRRLPPDQLHQRPVGIITYHRAWCHSTSLLTLAWPDLILQPAHLPCDLTSHGPYDLTPIPVQCTCSCFPFSVTVTTPCISPSMPIPLSPSCCEFTLVPCVSAAPLLCVTAHTASPVCFVRQCTDTLVVLCVSGDRLRGGGSVPRPPGVVFSARAAASGSVTGKTAERCWTDDGYRQEGVRFRCQPPVSPTLLHIPLLPVQSQTIKKS